MRRLILVCALILPLSGCASVAESVIGLPTGILTRSVENPVTRDHLFRLENGLIVGVAALNTYKQYCEGRPVGNRCDVVVKTLQGYTRTARPLLRQLRIFVRKNDQVNAKVVFQQVQALIAAFRQTAVTEGIPLPLELGVQ